MTVQRIAPPVALIVLWPKSVTAGSVAQQLVRRLSERRICSTWAVEEPSQAQMLRSLTVKAQPVELALMVTDRSNAIASIEGGLDRFAAAGEAVVAVHAGVELPRGSVERRLCQAGVRAVIRRTIRGESSTVRAMPFGLWEFGPHMSAPTSRRWLGLFGRATSGISELVDDSPALACIDLARASSMGSRGGRAVEQLVEQAAEASARNSARIVTIANLAAELSETTASRPQRSILRMAA